MNQPHDRTHDEVDELLEDLEGTQEIRAEIEHTRVEMSGTIDAIQEKLSPEVLGHQVSDKAQEVAAQVGDKAQEVAAQVVEQVKDQAQQAVREVTEQAREAVYEATVGRAEQAVSQVGETARGVPMTMMETIKQNPVPAAVAALSLGWLWANRSRGPAAPAYGDARGAYQYDTARGYGPERQQGTLGQVTDRVGETVGEARDTAGQVLGSASQTAGDVAGRAGAMAGEVVSGAGRAAGSAGETVTDLGGSIVETITRNPLPAALTGIGLAWLWMSRSSDDRRPRYAHSGGHLWQGNAGPGGDGGRSGAVGAMAGELQDRAGDLAAQAQGVAGETADQVRSAAGRAVSRVADTAGDLAGGAQYQAQRTGGRAQQMMEENPLMAGALAAAAGLAVGLATPATERENELMGQAREQLVRSAQGTAEETLDKVQQVATDAGDTVRKAAAEQKLTV